MQTRGHACKGFLALFLALFWAAAAFCGASCGLQNLPYLLPPASFSGDGENIATLQHNTSNYAPGEGSSQTFLGYEIYYRVFDDSAKADALLQQIKALQAQAGASSAAAIDASSLSSRNMMRLQTMVDATTGKQAPLVPVLAPDQVQGFNLNLKHRSDWTITDANNTSTIVVAPVVRSIVQTTRNSFYSAANYQNGDPDYTGASSPSIVYIVLAAVAFGRDAANIGGSISSAPSSPAMYFTYDFK